MGNDLYQRAPTQGVLARANVHRQPYISYNVHGGVRPLPKRRPHHGSSKDHCSTEARFIRSAKSDSYHDRGVFVHPLPAGPHHGRAEVYSTVFRSTFGVRPPPPLAWWSGRRRHHRRNHAASTSGGRLQSPQPSPETFARTPPPKHSSLSHHVVTFETSHREAETLRRAPRVLSPVTSEHHPSVGCWTSIYICTCSIHNSETHSMYTAEADFICLIVKF